MTKRAFILFAFVLLAKVSISAQAAMGNGQYGGNSMRNPLFDMQTDASLLDNKTYVLRVTGLMNIVADQYVATFNVMQIGETLEEVDNTMKERLTTFENNLSKFGIRKSQVKADLISLVPRYDFETMGKTYSKAHNEVPAGFEMQKNVTVLFNDVDQQDGIISAALQSDIYDIAKVDYYINNIGHLRDSLRAQCLKSMQMKMASLEFIDVNMSHLDKSMSEFFTTIMPTQRYASYQAFSRPVFKSTKRNQTFTEITKSVTRYYDPMSYAGFDVVINPVITLPVVQLSYSLTVKYIRKDETPCCKKTDKE